MVYSRRNHGKESTPAEIMERYIPTEIVEWYTSIQIAERYTPVQVVLEQNNILWHIC
jgi:hypothetical protein